MIAVLFDVDLTLVDAQRSGSKAMKKVFDELWGWSDALETIHMAGRTDHGILMQVLGVKLGRAPGPGEGRSMQDEFLSRYLPALVSQLAETPAVCCPGVTLVLERLEEVTPLAPGLATGNYQGGAMLKLASAGLDPARFAHGAFGDDHIERALLVKLAARRARAHAAADVTAVVVGDTPRDLEAARQNGLPCALVATGPLGPDELRELEPDLALEDLTDTDRFLSWLASLDA